MNPNLPEDFVLRMRNQLGDELSAFLHALDAPPVRGIRLNPLKPSAETERYTKNGRIPWSHDGFYLPEESNAGSSILHAAGAFYLQEPGAMIPAEALKAKPGEMILDLCAAPGGKSTQLGCAMRGEGLLVCNEPVPKRARILSGNIERMGLPNTLVTCETPDRLADRWPAGFDAVLVDAPCSGEGMFRRDPETRNEWTPEKAEGCAERQREILAAAARLVRPGGRLVYSTCTYNPAENEGNAAWFTAHFPEFHAEPFEIHGITTPDGMYTCYPHRIHGEGQFAALFRKDGDGTADQKPDTSLPEPSREESGIFRKAFPTLPEATRRFGETLVHLPFLPDIKGIRTIRAGLHLGTVRGRIAVPDHAAAMWFGAPKEQALSLCAEDAQRYTAGETVPGDMSGWTLLKYADLILGWGKGSDGVIKNHYPKGIRNPHLIP